MSKSGEYFTAGVMERIAGLVAAQPQISRRQLSLQVCEWLNWRSANGKLKEMSCRVKLLALARQGRVRLPVGGKAPPRKQRLPGKKGSWGCRKEVAVLLSGLGQIRIVAIRNAAAAESRVWDKLMQRHHYLGNGPLCGAQIRYLIESEVYGVIGGFAFSAAAWRIQARDRWIGWDDGARAENLSLVVNNSRLVIVPWVKAKNLASHALSQVVKRVGEDWRQRYGIEPALLETFVERGRYLGTSYRAANWIGVGQTRGRGP